MKKDLKDCTFIIPIRIESTDRLRNVITILCYLNSNFDTNIIVKEVDKESVFDKDALPQVEEYCGDISNIKYIFEKSDDPIFLREKILNEMLVLTSTNVVVNYDCDVVFPITSYLEAYRKIMENESDMIYPYGEGPWQYKIFCDDQMVSDFLNNDVSADLTTAKDQLEKLILGKSDLYNEKMIRSERYSYNSAMTEMLKDTGIKTKIIKQYLPVMNTLINQYLQVLDFYVHFDLDEEFNETIRSRHRDDFTYDSFSEGEKQRIDLSLLFTWRQIAKMKNSVSTNLLILDETFDSSLDYEGVENLLKILTTLPDETNVFVISHKGEILDNKFEDKIEFVKVKNFSKIAA